VASGLLSIGATPSNVARRSSNAVCSGLPSIGATGNADTAGAEFRAALVDPQPTSATLKTSAAT
jgi:hypothetical protein